MRSSAGRGPKSGVESEDLYRRALEHEENCYISMTSVSDRVPDRAIFLLWISVHKWISACRAEKLPEIHARRAINGAAAMSQPATRARESLEASPLTPPAVSHAARKQLCIVARHPLVSGVFVAGLTTAVGLRDELEVIVDRRQGGASAAQPPLERRYREHVLHALERDGFAVVPIASTETPSGRDVSPLDRLAEEPHLRKLERILWSKNARILRLNRWLILSVLMNAILALSVMAPAMTARWSQARPTVSSPATVAPGASIPQYPAPTSDQAER